jgi:hypothetical protein
MGAYCGGGKGDDIVSVASAHHALHTHQVREQCNTTSDMWRCFAHPSGWFPLHFAFQLGRVEAEHHELASGVTVEVVSDVH